MITCREGILYRSMLEILAAPKEKPVNAEILPVQRVAAEGITSVINVLVRNR